MRPLATLALAAATCASCTLPDPVHDRAVERLGPEGPDGPSPLHRAGQPCATCHDDFSVAGTVFDGEASTVGVEGARIHLVDALGTSPPHVKPVVTNRAGSFFVRRSDWSPVFPIRVRISKDGSETVMKSDIGRAASCADCHAPPGSPAGLTKDGPVWIR